LRIKPINLKITNNHVWFSCVWVNFSINCAIQFYLRFLVCHVNKTKPNHKFIIMDI